MEDQWAGLGTSFGASVLIALVLIGAGMAGNGQRANAATYEFDPRQSLTGECGTSSVDKVPDPGCPDPPHPGAFVDPRSIAIDSFGNEYVASLGLEGEGGRIDVFSPSGAFITSLPDPYGAQSLAVDSLGNLYAFEAVTGASGEVVRYPPSAYEPEAGKIQYDGTRLVLQVAPFSVNGGIAIDRSNDHLFVAHGDVSEFSSALEGNQLLNTIEGERIFSALWVAVDAQRERLYVSSCPEHDITHCWILVYNSQPPFDLLEEVTGSDLPEGRFFSAKGWTSIAVDEETGHFFVDDLEQTKNVYEFDANYDYVSTLTYAFNTGAHALQIALSNAVGSSNDHYLFVPSHPTGIGHAFAFRPAAEAAPEIKAAAAGNIGQGEAELRATIAPNGGATEYSIEVVSQATYEEDGFAGAQIVGKGVVDSTADEANVSAAVNGLTPGEHYRFRVIANNGAGGDEAEATFKTYLDALTTSACPNQALRTGFSAPLPDCRAYELVTPPDPNAHTLVGRALSGDIFKTLMASPGGTAVTYLLEGGALPGTEGSGSFNGTVYKAEREDTGWTTVSPGPSGRDSTLSLIGGISPEQGHLFWTAYGEGPAVLGGKPTRYVRYPNGASVLVGQGSLGTDPAAAGRFITEDGSHIVFQTFEGSAVRLEPEAPESGTQTIYDRTPDEVTHVVSLLPEDKTPAAGEDALYVNSSEDGSAIAFALGTTLYLRVDNETTYKIGDNLVFEGLSANGRRLFYLEGGKLFSFKVESEERIAFASNGAPTVVNVAPDGSRAYFVSTSILTGTEANPNGAIAKKGKQNLYLSEEGTLRFVGTVTDRDVEGESPFGDPLGGLGLWAEAVGASRSGSDAKDPSRVSADGSVILFESRAKLDGYDPGGFPQIYRYDSHANRLDCISCIPTQEAASGGASLQSLDNGMFSFAPTVFIPNLRIDGRRAFFQSNEALVSADTDGVQDVYEWEDEGVGSCTRPDGCLYLISSGHSVIDNHLYGISRNGDDVFFITSDTLALGDDGTPSIYDARVNGGFPTGASTECIGEGCRPSLDSTPSLTEPAKAPAGRARHCPRGKRKVRRHGKVRCVKKHHRHHRSRSGTRKGAGK